MAEELKPGVVLDGFRFVGGNPADQRNWEPEGLKIGTVDEGFRFLGGSPNDQKNWEDVRDPGLIERAKQGVSSTIAYGKINQTDNPAEIASIVAEREQTALPQTEAQRQIASRVMPNVQEAENAEGFVDTTAAYAKLIAKLGAELISNPKETLGMIAENLPNSAPGLAGSAIGAGAGAATPIPGGAFVGGFVGGTAGGYMVEQGSSMYDQIIKEANARGIDTKDAKALQPLIEEKYSEFLDKSRLKGAGTAGTDAALNMITLGLAGAAERSMAKGAAKITDDVIGGTLTAERGAAELAQIEAKQAARNTIPNIVIRGTGVTAGEMAGEGLSEAVGQKLAYDQVDPYDVAMEGLLGVGQGTTIAAGRGAIGKAGEQLGINTRGTVETNIKAAKQAIEASRQRAEADLGASTNVDQAIDAANRLASSTAELDAANVELGAATAAYNNLNPDLSVPSTLTPDQSIELAAAKGAIERTGSLDLSQPAPVIAPAAERAAAADTALRTIEANDGVATPAQAAIVDSVFPGRQNYDQVVGTSEQVPTVSNGQVILDTSSTPRETVRFDNPLQAENAAAWERFNAQRASRNAEQSLPQQASAVANETNPVAIETPQVNVPAVIEALQVPAFQRTAEQNVTLQKAAQILPQADMQLLETAAQSRFNLSAEQKIRLNTLEKQGVFPQNTETAPAQENAKFSTERDVTEDLPAAEQIMTFNQMGEGFTLLNQQQMPDGRTLYTYRSDSVPANLNPQVTSAQNNPQVVNVENNPQVVSQTGTAVPEVGTTMPNTGTVSGQGSTVKILYDANAQFDPSGVTGTIEQNGKSHTFSVIERASPSPIEKLVQLALSPFGKVAKFYTSDTLQSDGFVLPNDNKTVYINANSRMNPVAVAFHELMHLIKRDNPIAYRAIAAVVRRNLKADTPLEFRKYYNSATGGTFNNDELTDSEIEEIAADLLGNAATTQSFLSDVFIEVSKIAPPGEARSIIVRLAAAINKAIKAAIKAIKAMPVSDKFKTDEMISDLEEVRAALLDLLKNYAIDQKQSAMRMAAEVTQAETKIQLSPSLENTTVTENAQQMVQGTMASGATLQTQGAENAAENDTGRIRGVQQNPGQDRPGSVGYGRDQNDQIPGFGNDTGRAGGIRVQGVHFSKGQLSQVDGNFYGTNVSRNNGAEAARVRSAKDSRLGKRGYFYINTGNGIKPEAGVGSVPHTAYLNNLYDTETGIITARDANEFESAVLDAGFDGYINRSYNMAVVLGNKQVPVVPSDGTAEVVPAANKTASVSSELSSIKSLPSGELTRERWGQVIKSTRPDLYEKIEPTGAFNGEERVYKDGLVKFSPQRGLKPEVANAVDGIKKVAASLTETERAKLRKDTGEKMVAIYRALPSSDEIAAVAYAGKAKRGWYRHSVEAIQHIFGADGWRFAALLAATSPQNSVEMNLENTLRIWSNWIAAGRPTGETEILEIMGRSVQGNKGVDSVLGAWRNNSYRALQADSFADVVLSGPKVDSFMRNLNGDYTEVTNDAWMANYALIDQTLFSGSANKAGTEPGKGAGYLAMSAKTREAAKKLGWQPAEVQETVWSWAMSMLETMDRSDETRGAIELLDQGALTDDVINATPDFRSLFREPRYADILRNGGYGDRIESLPKPVRDQNDGDAPFPAAKMNKLLADAGLRLEFLQRQRRTNAQVSWEARPGESTGILPGMHTAPLELQQQYLADIYAAIERAGFTEKMGFSLRNTLFGPSAWEGKVLAGAQTMSRPGVVADNQGGVVVDPETRKKLELVASVLGLALRQEGVYWHYPVYKNGKPENDNGIEINFGRSLTNAEMQRLYDIISKRAGHSMWAPANTPIGVRILNFTDTPHKEFHRSIKSAATQFLRKFDGNAEFKSFSADGDAIENNWKESPDGQAYRLRISEARRPDLLEWANGQLQTEVDAVNREFSEKYGWGAATLEERAQAQEVKLSPPRFYSQLEQTVAQVPARISTQPAPQWKAWLASNASKYGIKKDEIEWSGINDYLDLRGKDKVTAQEIGEYLNLNNVKIDEVIKGDQSKYWNNVYDRLESGDEISGYRWDGENLISPYNDIVNGVNDLMDAADMLVERTSDSDTKYGKYTLPGGRSYREMLLTLPAEATIKGGWGTIDDEGFIVQQYNTEQEARQAAADGGYTYDKVQPSSGNTYNSSHWEEANVLAHIRYNERADVDGKSVLFIEEIQSDFAQDGRKRGFAEKYKPEDVVPAKDGAEDQTFWYFDVPGNMFQILKSKYPTQQEAKNYILREKRTVTGGVPDAPFVKDTKSWVALAVKRVMLLAAQGNYDKVAFINGKQSADRYDLSKQVDAIAWERDTDGRITFTPEKDNSNFPTQTVTAEELSDQLGKEIADKINSSTENDGYLEGVDLKVGGEGMKSFYDRIVPQVVNDVIKKLGGRMESVPLNILSSEDTGVRGGREHPYAISQDVNEPFDGNVEVIDRNTDQVVWSGPRAGATSFIAEALGNATRTESQPGFTITPEMRQKLQGEGLPLFSPSRQSVADAISSVDLKSDIANQVKFKLADIIAPGNGFNWFHKTIGTQFHKAKVNPLFKKVFDIGQQFLDDVTLFATRAEDKAMDIFPRFGLTKQLLKMGLSKADNELIGRALADGTLENGADPHTGVVWTDAQLRQKYNMTDKQIELYRQARAAIDQSLEDLAKSEMGQHMRVALKMSIAPLMRSNMSLKQIRDLLVQTIDQALQANPNADKSLTNARSKINEIYSTTTNLQNHGYAPLMRFGRWTVTATDANGDVQFFQMANTKSEASLMAKNLGGQYAKVEVGEMSQEAFKLFKGVSPDTLELFAKSAALPTNDLMQQYLSLAISSRSAMKRLINRKGTSGYSLDATRTLATFITSNARRASTNLNASDMKMAADAIPKEQGDVKDEAVNLVTYLQNPGEEAAKIRGFLFFQYLGGSIASGIVNLTQPILQTYPYLSQFGAVKAGNAMKVGMTAATSFLRGKRVSDPQLQLALERAKAEGLIDPQEIYQLMAASQSGAGSFLSYKFMRLWGLNFAVTELINRALTFSAAFEVGKSMSKQELSKAGATDAYNFAQNAIYETQGIYNKGNRPDWARGAVGGTIFTFKQFSISYVEFLTRLYKNDKKAFGIALAILIMAAGLQGLPGADDLDDVIDTAGNWMGYATNTKRWKRELLESVLGKDMAAFALHGVSTIPGMPIDVQARLGLGNMIPGTGLMNPTKKDKAREIAEVFGVAGGMAMSTMDTAEALALGDVRRAGLSILPGAIRNFYQASEMAATGEYRDQRGRKVQDVTTGDVIAKAIGFQPAEIAAANRRMREVQADIDIVKTKQEEINGKYARALVDNDQNELTDVRAELADWNKKNPDLPIRLNMSAIRQRVKQARLTKEARFIKSAPKQIRSQVRESLTAD